MRNKPGLYVDIPRAYKTLAGSCDSNTEGVWYLQPSSRNYTVGNVTFDLPKHHVEPDQSIVRFLVEISRRHSILDLGAGVGQYARSVMYINANATYVAFDGANGLDRYARGIVGKKHLHVQQRLPRLDWVVSLETGEHIPSKNERCFVSNLHRHNTRGVVLSWAVLGRFGYGHVNNHSPGYVRSLFTDLGYIYDVESTRILRQRAHHPWFRQTLYIFHRQYTKTR